jgi:hypothetical protein
LVELGTDVAGAILAVAGGIVWSVTWHITPILMV